MNLKLQLIRNSTFALLIIVLASHSLASASLAQGIAVPKNPNAAKIAQRQMVIASTQEQIASLTDDIKELRTQMVELNNKRIELFAKQDSLGISSESFGEIMKGLQANRVDLKIDLAGLNARKSAMLTLRAKSEKEHKVEMLEPLMKVLDLEEKNLADAEQLAKTKSVSQSAVRAAQLKVLEAEIRLAQARQPKTGARFTDELLNIALDESEKEARLAKVEELLDVFAASRKSLEEGITTTKKFDSAAQHLSVLESELKTANKQLGYLLSDLEQLMNEGQDADDH